LQAQLRDDSGREIFEGGGQKTPSATQRVKFTPDPTPVLSAVITYYRP
jgi:hypothetical protein